MIECKISSGFDMDCVTPNLRRKSIIKQLEEIKKSGPSGRIFSTYPTESEPLQILPNYSDSINTTIVSMTNDIDAQISFGGGGFGGGGAEGNW